MLLILARGLSAAALLPSLLLLASPGAQARGDGWRHCAEQGGVCEVRGNALVRYGVPGNWATGSVRGDVMCSNETFGDPAPGSPKRCELAGRQGGGQQDDSDDYVFCAAEGQVCRFRGSADVRFGSGDRFATRRAHGSVRCDVTAFGDPYFGVTKHCQVPRRALLGNGNGNGASGGSWGDDDGWRYCAAEGQTCKVRGRATVRFGDGQRFAKREVSGEVACTTDVFGDPSFGVIKHCEVQTSGWGGGWGGDSGSQRWQVCAEEGGLCRFSGRAQVRYGTAGRYQYRDAWDSVRCNNDAFGGDPYPNRRKRCEVMR
jgi:hypothetical protein